MPRRGHSTTIGKIAKVHRDRRVSEIRLLGERLRREQLATSGEGTPAHQTQHETQNETQHESWHETQQETWHGTPERSDVC